MVLLVEHVRPSELPELDLLQVEAPDDSHGSLTAKSGKTGVGGDGDGGWKSRPRHG